MPSFTVVDETRSGIWLRAYHGRGFHGVNFYEPSHTVELEDDGPYEVRLQQYTRADEAADAAWDPQIIIHGVEEGDVITVTSMDQEGGWTKESARAPASGGGAPERWMPSALGSGPQHPRPIFFTSDPTEMLTAEMAERGEEVFSDPDWEVGPDKYYWEGDAECVDDYRKAYDEGIEWTRVSSIPGAVLFVDEGGQSFQDVVQGHIGDCWLCSIFSSFANVVPMERLQGLFVSPVLSDNGLYVVRLWIEGAYRYLPIDDRIPFREGEPVGLHAKDARELWTMLLEKAFAKWAYAYQMLRGGLQNDVTPIGSARALQAVSGASRASEKDWQNGETTSATDELWAEILAVKERGILSTCSSGLGEDGIVSGHVFTLLDAREVVLPEASDLPEDDAPEAANEQGPTTFTVVDDTGRGIWFRSYSGEDTMSGVNFFEPSYTAERPEGGPFEVRIQSYTKADEARGAPWKPQIVVEGVEDGDVITVTSFKQHGGWTKGRASRTDRARTRAASPGRGIMEQATPGSTLRMVRVRNPWASSTEFTGEWSDGSIRWRYYPEVLAAMDHTLEASDGSFCMLFEDFVFYFGCLAMAGPI